MRAFVQIYFIPLNHEFWNRQIKKQTSMFSHYNLNKQQLLRPLPSSHVQTLFNEVISTHSKHMKIVLLLSVLKSFLFMDCFKFWLEKPSSWHSEGLKKKNKHPAESIEVENSELTNSYLPIATHCRPRAVGKSALKGKYWPLYPSK